MRVILLLTTLLCVSFSLWAQPSQTFKVKAGEIVGQVIPKEEQYRYSAFQPGTIFFTNGNTLPVQLNYHMLYGEMQFIDSKGDTLAIGNGLLLKHIAIGQQVFYYQAANGYLEVIAQYPAIKLAKKQLIKVVLSEEPVANGYEFSAPKRVSLDRQQDDFYSLNFQKLYTQPSKGDLVLVKEVSYMLIDKNTRFHPVRLSILSKLFPKHKKAIYKYVEENQSELKKEEEMKKLLEYCSQLAAN